MINPFFNTEEQRLRAFFRVVIFIFLFVLMMVASSTFAIEWVDYILRSLLIFGLYYLMLRYVDLRDWWESGLHLNKKWIEECAAGILIAATVMALIFLVEWLTGGLSITGYGWQRNGEVYWLFPLLIFLIQMISVGFYEEIMARGYLLKNIAEGFSIGNISAVQGTIIAIVISSSIFGLGHAGNPNATVFAVLNIILAGVMLAVPFVVTGRLAYSIGLHFAWNFFQGGIFGFKVSGMTFRNSVIQIQQSGPDWWTGGSFGPEGGLIGISGIILILVFVLLHMKMTATPIEFSTDFSEEYVDKKRKFTPTDELA